MAFEVTAQKLVYGGEALAYHEGRVVLVPRVLPGERVEVEEWRTAKGVTHARPLRILAPAPERVEPPCPYFGRCGGCHYQHLSADKQTAAKREILRETLRRIGKITWDAEIPVHAADPCHYRNQAQLKVAAQPDGRVELGFFEAESHRLCPVAACTILSPRLNEILGELAKPEWGARFAACQEVELLADERDQRVMMMLRGLFQRDEAAALARDLLAGVAGVVSVAVESARRVSVFGEPVLTYRVGEFEYQVSPGSFFQASRFLVPEFVAAVTAARERVPESAIALDLYAGVGLFTLPLARRFTEVIGVEVHPGAARDLAANAQRNGVRNVRAAQESAFDFLRRFARAEPDFVVLDPPRAGAEARTLKLLAALRPKSIEYVSCHPPTMARDLGYLTSLGYRLNSVEFFDLFPQTFHLESLARLERASGQGLAT